MNITWNPSLNINVIESMFRQELKWYIRDLTQLQVSLLDQMSNVELLELGLNLLKSKKKTHPQTYKEFVNTSVLGHDNNHIEKIIHTQRVNLLNKLSSILVEFSDDEITLRVRTSIILLTKIMRELENIN